MALYQDLADLVVTVDNRTPEEVARFIKCMVIWASVGRLRIMQLQKAFPEAELVSLGTITEVIKSCWRGTCDYAVIPVENSIEGPVHESLDYLFHRGRFVLRADCSQPIKQQLMATKHHEKIEIFTPTGYCPRKKSYILNSIFHMLRLRQQQSTAFAARFVVDNPDQPCGHRSACSC